MKQSLFYIACNLTKRFLSKNVCPSSKRTIVTSATFQGRLLRNERLLTPRVTYHADDINVQNNLNCCQSKRFFYFPSKVVHNLFNQIDLRYEILTLKKFDGGFDEGAFEYGATQALITLVSIIQRSSWDEIRGLVPMKLAETMQVDEEFLQVICKLKNFSTSHITHASITNVRSHEIVDKKYCDIDIEFKAAGCFCLSGVDVLENPEAPLEYDYLHFKLRFFREYTEGILPEWTITSCKVQHLKY